VFGKDSAGSPFNIYAPGIYQGEKVRSWSYAVMAGDSLKDNWPIRNFENSIYHLQVYGPNGFFRDLKGDGNDPDIEINCIYENILPGTFQLTGNLILDLANNGTKLIQVDIVD